MEGPKLRLSKYTEPWKSYTISELFDRVGTPVELEENAEYQEIGIRSHGKGLFYKEKTTAKEIGNKRVFWIEPDCFIVNIVFAWERAVAKTTEAEVGMIASHRFPMYKPKKGLVDLDYITQYFTTKRGQNVLILASPGGAGRNKTLGQKEFAESSIKIPTLKEQKSISLVLSSVNEIINIAEEEVYLWKEKKKGIMQKIFSQEVRFKDENGEDYPEWEDATLEELLDFEQPTKYIVKSTQYDPSYSIPVLTAGQSLLLGYTDEIDGIYPADASNPVIIFDDFTTSYHWIDYPFKVKSSAMKILTPVSNKDMLFEYVYYAMGMIDYKPTSHSRQWISTFSKFTIHLPCIEEQKRIIECLSSIDEVIILKKQKLEAWQNIKKGLLQQMFV